MVRSFEVMSARYLVAILLLGAALLVIDGGGIAAQAQNQPGGGSLPGDAMGGAALIFHKPDNPPLHSGNAASPNSAGGGRVSGSGKIRAAAAQERVIAKGNAARS